MRYTVKAAARSTGVAEERLRTWERRYGVPRPDRSSTGRRLYSEADLAIIRRMLSLIDAGMGAAEAAEAAVLESIAPRRPAPTEHPSVAALVAAAIAFDEAAVQAVLREAVASHGWGEACDAVLFPGMRRLGEEWQAGKLITTSEHLVSEVIKGELWNAISQVPTPPTRPLVLFASPPRERHDLGLLALTLLVRQIGVRAVFLGADVPVQDLLAMTDRTGAEAICLSAATATARASMEVAAREIVADGKKALLFVGGPALADQPESASIPGLRLPGSLPAAAVLIADRLGAAAGNEARAAREPSVGM